MKISTAKPARYLTKNAKKLWHSLHSGHQIDDAGGLLLLDSVCSAFDEAEAARRILAEQGLIVEGRQGSKPHPCVMVEHNSVQRMLTALRLLRLSPEDVK